MDPAIGKGWLIGLEGSRKLRLGSAGSLIMRGATLRTWMTMLALSSCLALGLAGCGVRGSMKLPGETKNPQKQTATADSGQGKPEGQAPKPHQPFILDGLLR
jgi:predicted small lipoprotein YifL